MTRLTTSAAVGAWTWCLLPVATALAQSGPEDAPAPPALHPPERVLAGGSPIAVEAPGFAFPAWYDATGDGRADLVVGQFAYGKIRIHPRAADGTFGAGHWLEAGGEVAQVPGVW
ncbi:MAG: hypothetical protein AAFU73_03545 [Planctomycetota bacterium]